MAPRRKKICDCGMLESASKESRHPIRFNPEMNEYFIAHGRGGSLMIYYCPFCGGKTPQSRRSSFFAHVSTKEMARIHHLFDGIRTVADVIARYGRPDEEIEAGAASFNPEKGKVPPHGIVYRTMIYKSLSRVADVVFYVGAGESVQGGWRGKYLGDRQRDKF